MKKIKFIAIALMVGLFASCESEEEESYLEPHNTRTGDKCGTVQGHYTGGGKLYLMINNQYIEVNKETYDMVGDGREMCL